MAVNWRCRKDNSRQNYTQHVKLLMPSYPTLPVLGYKSSIPIKQQLVAYHGVDYSRLTTKQDV